MIWFDLIWFDLKYLGCVRLVRGRMFWWGFLTSFWGLGTSTSEHVDLTAVTRGVWSFNNFWNKRSRCSSVFENQHCWWSWGALSKSLNAKSLHISEHDCFWLRRSRISSIILGSVLTYSWEVCFALPWGTLPRGQIAEYSTMVTCCRDRYFLEGSQSNLHVFLYEFKEV
jgi:hypothetical protein